MYKLFLCLRYLRSRIIAYFAVLAVALCVAMMLIVVSVMNGFLDKIEQAAKGLFGDVVIESGTVGGFGRYDEFIAEIKQDVPEVEDAAPFILTFGMLRVPDTDYRQIVQIAGIRLPDQAKVTAFGDGLRFEEGAEALSFDPDFDLLLDNLAAETGWTREILARYTEGYPPGAALPADRANIVRQLRFAAQTQMEAAIKLEYGKAYQQELRDVQQQLSAAEAAAGDERTAEIEELELRLDTLREDTGLLGPANRIILGLGIPGLSFRTPEGETIRYMVPGKRVVLSLLPLGRGLASDIAPSNAELTVVDDCKTDVSSIDSEMVYIPFETLQTLNNMDAGFGPARCSQIHVKVRPDVAADDAKLLTVAARINGLWADFLSRHPDAATTEVTAQTWRQRQARIIAPIQQQRTLVVTMFAIISLVSVVLIFVIFYTIVVQKTRDIGVVKAIGGSSWGVANIFLGYGAMIGLVGAVIGCIGGYYFVRYINPIQDALDAWLGFRVWSKEWFLFEKIPNTVEALPAVLIMVGAILAGLVGALIPAWRAARMQPVEALRYE